MASTALGDAMVTRRCGSLTGKARNKRLFTSEKMAALAPMPRARDKTATIDTIGVARRARMASRRSRIRHNYRGNHPGDQVTEAVVLTPDSSSGAGKICQRT